ncbi:MAG TPA: M61 family peptidase [Terriglobia bacterium]|nr:M61 family peptidase [Terriglobia bacterium]
MNLLRYRLSILVLEIVALGLAALPAQARPTITLTVDATQAPEKMIYTHMSIPVKPGPLTLYYPKWVPGGHSPMGSIGGVGGLKFMANGKTVAWRRDLLDVFTFHVDVPDGTDTLEAAFDFVENGYATDKLIIFNWNQYVLYPAGFPTEEITYSLALRLPEGWKFATALAPENVAQNEITFKPVSLNQLVDSPVVAGEYFRAVDVTPAGEPIHHELDIVADSEAALALSPEVRKALTNLVTETGKLFGARHYRDYRFLLTLSNHVGHGGLEHHECNDSRTDERALLTPEGNRGMGALLSHEFVHSWNGKFRRPADLSTPDFEAPMKTDLLWVYEGLTDFLGNLLATRSGLWTPEQYRESLAGRAADMGPGRPGRTWRPLQDTADAVPGLGGGGWANWRRGVDYYPEGDLLWLEVSTLIHDVSHGQKSIEDFCHLFYGGPNKGPELRTYTFEELVRSLNQVVPYDWAGFFHARLTSTSPEAPVGGIEAGGWKVEYSETPPEGAGHGVSNEGMDATYSIGLSLSNDGRVQESLVGGLAFKAGITEGMRVMAVNDRAFTSDLLHDALKAGKDGSQPIRLLMLNDDYYQTCTIDYHGGERYPHLVRVESKSDVLDDLAKPR